MYHLKFLARFRNWGVLTLALALIGPPSAMLAMPNMDTGTRAPRKHLPATTADEPWETPTESPTEEPTWTPEPTWEPTAEPTWEPTPEPTWEPTP